MSAQHTPGRLFVVESQEHWGRVNCHLTAEVDQSSIGSVWVNGTSQNRADARRLVACWNACEGLQTDLLESIAMMGDTLASRFKLRDETERKLQVQRDALLATLKVLTRSLSYEELMHDDQRDAFKQACAAIAKAGLGDEEPLRKISTLEDLLWLMEEKT